MVETALPPRPLALAGRTITTALPAFVMGIVNVNDRSFYAQSRAPSVKQAVERICEMEKAGADIIDIGAESTRPGACYLDSDEEIAAIIPVIEAARKRTGVPLSVDTRKACVAQRALVAGADMINDISALEDDPALSAVLARTGAPVVLMHKRGCPQTMDQMTGYQDVVGEVCAYLADRAEFARACGIEAEKIIVDPGIGFAKTTAESLDLIACTETLCALGYPLLMALSRKRVIGEVTGRDAEGRLAGTLSANLLAVLRGASIVRVHDVAATVDSLKVLSSLARLGAQEIA